MSAFPEIDSVYVPTTNQAIEYLRGLAQNAPDSIAVPLTGIANFLVRVVQLLEAVADGG